MAMTAEGFMFQLALGLHTVFLTLSGHAAADGHVHSEADPHKP